MMKKVKQEKGIEISGLGEQEVKKVQEAFTLFNRGDKVDLKEIKATLNALGVDKGASMFNLITGFETKQTPLDFPRFADRIANNISDWDSRNSTDKIFQLFDTGKLGLISIDDLKKIASELNLPDEPYQIEGIIKRLSSNGKITKEDFYEILSKRSFLA